MDGYNGDVMSDSEWFAADDRDEEEEIQLCPCCGEYYCLPACGYDRMCVKCFGEGCDECNPPEYDPDRWDEC